MIPCPGSTNSPEAWRQNQNPFASAVRSPNRLQASCFGWIRDDSTDPGIGAGTQRLLAALFPAAQPSLPSPRVRPHPRSLDRRFGQFVVSASGRCDRSGFPLFALTGPRSTAPNVVSPFSHCLGLLRRGPAQGPRPDRHTRPPWGRLSRPLLLGRLFPAFLHSATYLLGGFVRCRLFR